jgi:hypothetical protein
MNKHTTKPKHHKFSDIRPLYFLILALISGVICVAALRANNQHMSQLREEVYAADKDNGDVKTALQELQSFVTTHMNTNLSTGTSVYPPIQLKYTYERLQQAQNAQLGADSDIYTQAQKYCEAQNSVDFSGRNRVPCIEQYVSAHKSGQPQNIPEDLYKFSFATPLWAPDIAGFSLIATIIFGLLFVLSLAVRWFNKRFE